MIIDNTLSARAGARWSK